MFKSPTPKASPLFLYKVTLKILRFCKNKRGHKAMIDYEKMYKILFNAITDALDELYKGCPTTAENILKQAQLATEDIYINSEETL